MTTADGAPRERSVAVAYSDDGRFAVTSEMPGTVLWDGLTGDVLQTLPDVDASELSWISGRAEFVLGATDGSVTLYRVR